MLKIFVTGDNHFGKKYDRYPDAKEKLIESRFDSFRDMVKKADEEGCALFVVTGDLFDNISNIKVSDVKQVADALCGFSGSVIVLPGNHDYFTGEEKVWKDFEDALDAKAHNITLIKEFKPYDFEAGDEKVVVYPAFCQAKHSKENNLGWIKDADIQQDGVINIGLAHGAIKGITPDIKEEYFLMTETELEAIPVDVWLIGHTHIPYPGFLDEHREVSGYRIFNAGTHEQTDLHNITDGNCFIITVDKANGGSKVSARKVRSGRVKYHDIQVQVKPTDGEALREMITLSIVGCKDNSIIRLKISGSVKQSEYQDKDKIYKEMLGGFLSYEIEDSELSEEITVEKIRTEYAETSFAAQFMEALTDNPTELAMAYRLLKECKEN